MPPRRKYTFTENCLASCVEDNISEVTEWAGRHSWW